MARKGYSKRRPRKKGVAGTVILWLIMLAVVAGVVLQFAGPYVGWFEKAVVIAQKQFESTPSDVDDDPDEEPAPEDQDDPTPTEDPVSKSDDGDTGGTGEDPPTEKNPLAALSNGLTGKKPTTKPTEKKPDTKPEKIDYKKLYEKFLKEETAKLKKPRTGKVYTIPTTQYDIKIGKAPTYKGILMVISNDRAILRRLDNNASVTITPDILSDKWVARIFPRIIARRHAVERLDKAMGDQTVASTTPKKKPTNTNTRPDDTVTAVKPPTNGGTKHTNGSTTAYRLGARKRLTKYDPTQAKTPKYLGHDVKMYGQWIEMQQRRAGGTLVRQIYAKDQGGNIVMYMVMHPNFTRQDFGVRETSTEMFWSMWSRRCRESGKTRTLQSAHIVLLDSNRRIIGGSRVRKASDVWVKR